VVTEGFQQLVQDQVVTIALLQSQLNTTAAPTIPPTPAPTGLPTQAPSRSPTTSPTRPPTTAPTRVPTRSPTPAPTDLPLTIAPSVIAPATEVAMRLGLLSSNGTFFGDLRGLNEQYLLAIAPLFDDIVDVTGDVTISMHVTALNFPRLQSIGGSLTIADTPIASLDECFPELRSVGNQLRIQNNADLQTLNGSFPQLQSIGRAIYIYGNSALTSVGTGLASLTRSAYLPGATIGVNVYQNAAGFCSSYAPRLCWTTSIWQTSGSPDDANTCCTQFCSISTLC
jgi:hypothetical protein